MGADSMGRPQEYKTIKGITDKNPCDYQGNQCAFLDDCRHNVRNKRPPYCSLENRMHVVFVRKYVNARTNEDRDRRMIALHLQTLDKGRERRRQKREEVYA
jgi:hypothetical protein